MLIYEEKKSDKVLIVKGYKVENPGFSPTPYLLRIKPMTERRKVIKGLILGKKTQNQT